MFPVKLIQKEQTTIDDRSIPENYIVEYTKLGEIKNPNKDTYIIQTPQKDAKEFIVVDKSFECTIYQSKDKKVIDIPNGYVPKILDHTNRYMIEKVRIDYKLFGIAFSTKRLHMIQVKIITVDDIEDTDIKYITELKNWTKLMD